MGPASVERWNRRFSLADRNATLHEMHRAGTQLIALLLIILRSHSLGDDLATALSRYEKLQELAKQLKPHSTPKEVEALMGKAVFEGRGGWNGMERRVWWYLNYTDDGQNLELVVEFDRQNRCSSRATHLTRDAVAKQMTNVRTGTVLQIYRPYPAVEAPGFLCDVRFNDGTISGVGVDKLSRVTGQPKIGSRIRIEYYGTLGDFNFVAANSLSLESIEFSGGTP